MSYTVKKGDTLSKIASQYHVSLAALEKANSQIKNFNVINVGQKINIPGQSDGFQAPATSPAKGGTYTVKSGDTLSKIASSHGVSLAALEKANPQIKNFNVISVGQKINLPGGAAPTTGAAPSSGGAKGTNAASIAEQYLGRYESDLQRAGVTKPCPTSESCANFVSSML